MLVQSNIQDPHELPVYEKAYISQPLVAIRNDILYIKAAECEILKFGPLLLKNDLASYYFVMRAVFH